MKQISVSEWNPKRHLSTQWKSSFLNILQELRHRFFIFFLKLLFFSSRYYYGHYFQEPPTPRNRWQNMCWTCLIIKNSKTFLCTGSSNYFQVLLVLEPACHPCFLFHPRWVVILRSLQTLLKKKFEISSGGKKKVCSTDRVTLVWIFNYELGDSSGVICL